MDVPCQNLWKTMGFEWFWLHCVHITSYIFISYPHTSYPAADRMRTCQTTLTKFWNMRFSIPYSIYFRMNWCSWPFHGMESTRSPCFIPLTVGHLPRQRQRQHKEAPRRRRNRRHRRHGSKVLVFGGLGYLTPVNGMAGMGANQVKCFSTNSDQPVWTRQIGRWLGC